MSELKLSASEWCYLKGKEGDAATFYAGLSELGYGAIEMPSRHHWDAASRAGLRVLNIAGPGMSGDVSLNRREQHGVLLPQLRECIALASASGIEQVIIFSGNRQGLEDDAGLRACVEGAKALAGQAEQAGVTLTLEVLNRFDHPDYQADSGAFAFDFAWAVSSPAVRVLYDIYHMHRMGEDVRAEVVRHLEYIAHLHVAGSPARNTPDERQAINYAGFVTDVLNAGYGGWWGMEFLPGGDPIAELDAAGALFRSYAASTANSMEDGV